MGDFFPSKDDCDCPEAGHCVRKPCPTTPTPTCDDCHELVEVAVGSCGCTKKECKPKNCPKYPKPNCTKCFESDYEMDKCECAKPVCVRKEEPTVLPPTCGPCQKPIKF